VRVPVDVVGEVVLLAVELVVLTGSEATVIPA
jgi:hypothetical protein